MAEPNALRCLAYFRQIASTFFAAPTPAGPSLSRPLLRMLNAITCPRPISPNTFSTGTGTLSRYTAVVELPVMPILCSSAPLLTPGKFREQLGRAAVCNPHLLAVQHVVFSIRGEIGPRSCCQRIRPRQRLGERIGGQHLHF